MPIMHQSLLRAKIIHKCLLERQARQQKISLQRLTDIISDQIDIIVSCRTVAEDIKRLRSDDNALGIVLPIRNQRNAGYYYPVDAIVPEDIMMPIDKELLKDMSSLLNQFSSFDFFDGYQTSLNVLLDGSDYGNSIIQLDYNPQSLGQRFIPALRQHIKLKESLQIKYYSFGKSAPVYINFLPSFLKIFNNRWFLVGYNELEKNYGVLPLDRIDSIRRAPEPIIPDPEKEKDFNPQKYFEHIIGVTSMSGKSPMNVHIRVQKNRAYYIDTKPLHSSQERIKDSFEFMDFRFCVKPNNELIATLLSFGSDLEVLKPASLRRQMQQIVEQMAANYK